MIKRIAELRKRLGLSQEQFAKKIDLSRSFINQVETGKKNISERTINDICREFKVNETWLRDGIGDPFLKIPREDEIRDFMADLLKAEPDDIRLRIVNVLARLTTEDWEFIEKRLLRLAEEEKAKTVDQTLETEARAEAELYYRQLLLEKEQARQALSAQEQNAG